MSVKEWFYSSYPNPHVDGQWGLFHILVLVFVVAFIVGSSLLLRKKNEKTKRIVVWCLTAIILMFEIARRVINLCKTEDYSFHNLMHILLPRPGCAISCWLIIIATLVNKKVLYNFASLISIIPGVIFFAYPGVGFNNEYILFENLYSIVTHTFFLITAICFITYGFTDFRCKTAWKELICFGILALYVFLEIKVLKIESDPFYFMPGNDVQEIVGLGYTAFLPLYILFYFIYFTSFYLINDRKRIFKRK